MDDDPYSKISKIKKKLFGKLGKYTVYLVDDNLVRGCGESAWEFSDYGVNLNHHGLPTIDFSFIPQNEIWLANSVAPSERHFILSTAVAYAGCIEAGLPPIKSYDKVMAMERQNRRRDLAKEFGLESAKQIKKLTRKEIAKKLYGKKYAKIKDGKNVLNVFLVNGEVTRGLYKTDFVEAGHGYVYKWIPKDEIWVDASLKAKAVPTVILHEFVERAMMRDKNFTYQEAHPIASKIEAENRGHFGKKDVSKLGSFGY